MVKVIVTGSFDERDAVDATAKCIRQAITSEGVGTIDNLGPCFTYLERTIPRMTDPVRISKLLSEHL